MNRPGLIAALNYLRPDDTLCVWRKLDRLDRSVKEVFTIAGDLHDKQIALQILTGTLSGTYRGHRRREILLHHDGRIRRT